MTRRLLALVLLVAVAVPAAAQQLAVDRGRRAGELWCFPAADDPSTWRYLPSSARLATDEDGLPEFSFLQYVVPEHREGDSADGRTLTEAGGGGILHFLVLYETPDEQVAEAQRLLRRHFEDDALRLVGPVIFDRGRFSLVSSILDPEAAGGATRTLLQTGRAPVLEGNRLALSFDLDPRRASLLLESLKMTHPDVSLVFELGFSGLTDAYDAELVVDWSAVKRSDAVSAGGSVYFVGADVEATIESLTRDGSIELRSAGSDAAMEALLARVYDKLLELLFRPVEPERIPAEERGGLLDALGSLVDQDGLMGSRETTGFGLSVGYRLKDLRTEGETVLRFDHRATVERNAFVTFNIGDLWRRYGDDPRFFKRANPTDPSFRQREVAVSIDGALLGEFERYINSVTVTLRKVHENGAVTLDEVVLDERAARAMAAGDTPPDLRMVYGWNDDRDRLGWLEYEVRAHWSFKGGGHHDTNWRATSSPMVDLFAPYERRRVQLLGSDLLADGVRAVVVRLAYPFFGEERTDQRVLRPDDSPDPGETEIEITLPLGVYDYDYSIQWLLDGGDRVTRDGRDASGVLFLDEMPTET